MDINKYLEPEFDFSRLNPIEFELRPDVTLDELVYVFNNRNSIVNMDMNYPIEFNRWKYIGFSHKHRCFEADILFENGKYVFINFNLLNEYGIRLLWCKKS